MDAQSALDVINGETDQGDQGHQGDQGIAATLAHELAGITYRQLDHWARQGWVRPSVDPGEGRSGKRLYSAGDVERLDLLRHLAKSGVSMSSAGPQVTEVEVSPGDVVVRWGPVGHPDAGLDVIPGAGLRSSVGEEGAWVVFDPTPVRERLARERLARERSARERPARAAESSTPQVDEHAPRRQTA